MPKLAFHIEADYQKVIKLREEIDKLKSTIAGMDSNTSPATLQQLIEWKNRFSGYFPGNGSSTC